MMFQSKKRKREEDSMPSIEPCDTNLVDQAGLRFVEIFRMLESILVEFY